MSYIVERLGAVFEYGWALEGEVGAVDPRSDCGVPKTVTCCIPGGVSEGGSFGEGASPGVTCSGCLTARGRSHFFFACRYSKNSS